MRNKCAPRFKGRRKEISFGRLLLRTEDKQVQLLPDQWKYWPEALEIMEYFDVRFCYIRSDAHRSYAIPTRGSIVINAPTSADPMVTIAHEAAHVGLHKQNLARHREEYETGFLEKLICDYYGIPVSEKQQQGAGRYVAKIIAMACNRGIKRFDRAAWEFADFNSIPQWRQTHVISQPELYHSHRPGFDQAVADWAR